MDYVLCEKCQTSITEIVADNYDSYCPECFIDVVVRENAHLKAEILRLNDRLDIVDL